MNDFKARILNEPFPIIYTNGPQVDHKHLGIWLMTKGIPKMYADGDSVFGFHFATEDIQVANDQEYQASCIEYGRRGLKMDKGDKTWFYDFKFQGKKIRCLMTTEIWFHPKMNMPLSPFAIILHQFFGYGFHYVRCKFAEL